MITLLWACTASEHGFAPTHDRPAAPPDADRVVESAVELTSTPRARPVAAVVARDVLFVVDPSSSMERVIDRVRAGLVALASERPFPPDTRIAVITTTPLVPMHLEDQVGHHWRANAAWRAMDPFPGVIAPVDAASIANFHTNGLSARQYPDAFAHPGCVRWFRPGDVDADGVPCIVAHTDFAGAGSGLEAGLTALKLALLTREVAPRGGRLDVVVVSDTHDPGINPVPIAATPVDPGITEADAAVGAAFEALRPTWDDLDEAAAAVGISDLRFHAIAPESNCGGESWDDLGPVYLDTAADAGGFSLDICTASAPDYVAFLRRIAR